MTAMRRELPARAGLMMMGWLTLVLWLDRAGGGGGPVQQRVLGTLTWLVLLLALSRVSPVVRAQTLVVVAFATAVEYVFSPTLGVYTYRFDNVPAFVPPGHGLVYLSAFALGHAALVGRHRRTAVGTVLVAGGAWALDGLLVADRPDALGAFWFGCLALFLLLGPSQAVYLGSAPGWAPGCGRPTTRPAPSRSATRPRGRLVATGGSTSPACCSHPSCCGPGPG
jgi:hypothetical protein